MIEAINSFEELLWCAATHAKDLIQRRSVPCILEKSVIATIREHEH